MNFVIADDDDDSRIYLERALTSIGHNVIATSNGLEALAAARSSQPDFIVSDILMPEMDGFQLCRKIKADPSLRDVPVVFYTATYTDEKDVELAKGLGASGYLLKPMEFQDIIAAINEISEGNDDGRMPAPSPTDRARQEVDELNLLVLSRKLDKKARELEVALKASERANAAKSNFLAHMSHELRTPLSAIIGLSELMRTEVISQLPDIYKDYCFDITTSGRYLLEIISDMFDLTQIQAGDLTLTCDFIDLVEVVKTAIDVLEGAAADSETTVTLTVSGPKGKTGRNDKHIYSDRIRVKQVITKLLSNAITWTPKGSVTVEVIYAADAAQIAITDTGVGMTENKIEESKRPYGHLEDPAYLREYHGMGLGIPLSRGLVDILGGQMDITSHKNKGTTVTVILPLDSRNGSIEPGPVETGAQETGAS